MDSGITDLTRKLNLLCEPVRLKILLIISREGSCCAADILSEFDFTQPTLSHHMSVLTEGGLVDAKKKGRFVYYSINKESVRELKKVLDMICDKTDKTFKDSKSPKRKEKKKKDKKKKKQ